MQLLKQEENCWLMDISSSVPQTQMQTEEISRKSKFVKENGEYGKLSANIRARLPETVRWSDWCMKRNVYV